MSDSGDQEGTPGAVSPASSTIMRQESMDYFDSMEVLYFDNLLHQQSDAENEVCEADAEEEDNPESSTYKNDDKNETKHKKGGIQGMAHHSRKKLHKMAQSQRKALEHTLRSRRKKLKRIMSEPKFVLTIDKLSFIFGVLIIMVIECVLLVAPEQMGTLYTTLLIPLMVARYIMYRADLFHYFMYDFCYFAQGMMLVYMYRCPENVELGKALFSISNGPLAR